MSKKKDVIRIAILGGGPSALFMYKRLVEAEQPRFEVTIFEKKPHLGMGMPYSVEGAGDEHVTNVSDNEVPDFVNSIEEWSKTAPAKLLKKHNIDPANFNQYKVLPRLFFGAYLEGQFKLLMEAGEKKGTITTVKTNCPVDDVVNKTDLNEVWVLAEQEIHKFDKVIIATGHKWPMKYEGLVDGYFDSPYPPSKIELALNHTVAIKGSSLTAIDAIRTLSRKNGAYSKDDKGNLTYKLNKTSSAFKIVMHSRNGMLPAVRFHLADSYLKSDALLTVSDFKKHKAKNDGFISLDFVFEKDFKEILKIKDPAFYEKIKALDVEAFVDKMMGMRETVNPFKLLKEEYLQAEKSIANKESIYWKEILAILSYSMNYPAKYFSAEDMIRLQKKLMPLISIVIAFVPQSSCDELLALHGSGVLKMVSVDQESSVEINEGGGIIYHYKNGKHKDVKKTYKTFVDCVGQPHLDFEHFPFDSLRLGNDISPAKLKFKKADIALKILQKSNRVELGANGEYYLKVPGIIITDNFQIVNAAGKANPNVYIMAVPYIAGFNPDYSGIDFCEEASKRIIKQL